jgi:hypothetical protein
MVPVRGSERVLHATNITLLLKAVPDFQGVGQGRWCRIGAVMLHKIAKDDCQMMPHGDTLQTVLRQRVVVVSYARLSTYNKRLFWP